MRKQLPIGQMLINKGHLTQKQLDRAIEIQKRSKGKRLGDVLVELNYVNEKILSQSLAEQLNIPYIELSQYNINNSAVEMLDRNFVQRNNILPIDLKNDKLIIATGDPLDLYIINEINHLTNRDVLTVIVRPSTLQPAIAQHYGKEIVKKSSDLVEQDFDIDEIDENLVNLGERIEGTPLVKLVRSIISQGAVAEASDIHIEPTKAELVVRFRINGDLVRHMSLSMATHNPIVSRLKLVSDMNIAEKRIPQDGKFHFQANGIELDVRTSSLPTVYGEKVVLRLLGNTNRPELLNIEKLGMDMGTFETFMEIVKSPNGIILVTGPTGSGKTTTLYATLNKLAQKPVNIITIEDPVEQRIDNTNQVQINKKAELTFSAALRSILRQDPDIIMVGEMRDSETALLGMRAAITGHLVLTTLHTNDTVSSIFRLIDMGCEPYMVSAAITGVIAQRLVKVLCPNCKKKRKLKESEKSLFDKDDNIEEVYEPVGCEKCKNTGYITRMPVYEIIKMDDGFRGMITNGKSVAEMRKYEKDKGNKFLRDNVIKIVKDGKTTIEEMEKIIYSID